MIYPQGGFGPFLSTPSARRATAGRHGSSATVAISIHALREEGDPPSSKSGRPSANFYPRPPRGGRLFCAARAASSRVFLSTPSARRATRAGEPFLLLPEISIHALREEGDTPGSPRPRCQRDFYPRPPRGGRLASIIRCKGTNIFLSTPSARRATECLGVVLEIRRISIHALREEGDQRAPHARRGLRYFYPRPPRGGRPSVKASSQISNYFYPRPPRGGRRGVDGRVKALEEFLSTPSARRATSNSPF